MSRNTSLLWLEARTPHSSLQTLKCQHTTKSSSHRVGNPTALKIWPAGFTWVAWIAACDTSLCLRAATQSGHNHRTMLRGDRAIKGQGLSMTRKEALGQAKGTSSGLSEDPQQCTPGTQTPALSSTWGKSGRGSNLGTSFTFFLRRLEVALENMRFILPLLSYPQSCSSPAWPPRVLPEDASRGHSPPGAPQLLLVAPSVCPACPADPPAGINPMVV